MHGPPVVAWLLVALSAATALSCVLRREARAEALLGTGMALMAVPLSVYEPPRWSTAVLAAVFAGAAVHALRPSAHRATAHRMHHSVCAGAMVYMAAATAGASQAHSGHAGHAAGAAMGTPLLTGLLLAYFAGYVLRAGTRLVAVAGLAAPPGGAIRLRHAPEVAAACRVAMAMGMFAMLLTM
ncbi:DUF5134 domain-containing protein [Streptomyces sp. NPDC021020]|uniref:DUF5134 domain-containing protein n=1 Tax=Streptomyces sp. NPDC021020 TaxID=3365109 RepID=UPI0037AB305D